jgi:hypothetical protein
MRYLRSPQKGWSRVLGLAVVLLGAGCGEGAKLVQQTDAGGVVVYPFRGDTGYLFTPLRRDAMHLMQEHCGGGGYSIVREGEAKGRVREAVSPVGREIVSERRWGMEFRCK